MAPSSTGASSLASSRYARKAWLARRAAAARRRPVLLVDDRQAQLREATSSWITAWADTHRFARGDLFSIFVRPLPLRLPVSHATVMPTAPASRPACAGAARRGSRSAPSRALPAVGVAIAAASAATTVLPEPTSLAEGGASARSTACRRLLHVPALQVARDLVADAPLRRRQRERTPPALLLQAAGAQREARARGLPFALALGLSCEKLLRQQLLRTSGAAGGWLRSSSVAMPTLGPGGAGSSAPRASLMPGGSASGGSSSPGRRAQVRSIALRR